MEGQLARTGAIHATEYQTMQLDVETGSDPQRDRPVVPGHTLRAGHDSIMRATSHPAGCGPRAMAKNSKIEWTHHTFNPWWGCVRVSPACKHCYAETWAHRLGLGLWGKDAPRRFLSDAYWKQPLAWDKEAATAKTRARVFCASMADVFEDRRDLDAQRARLWEVIARTPNLDWLLLTKRPELVGNMVPWGNAWPHNVWLGTTVETQRWAERRVPELLRHHARVRFLSCEPLLGGIDLTPWIGPNERSVDWVIVGGESGHSARPMNPVWARSLRDQCIEHGVAFHFKQWGNWRPCAASRGKGHESRTLKAMGEVIHVINVGKKTAGRRLDGTEWNQFPA
jgi:protein gp37